MSQLKFSEVLAKYANYHCCEGTDKTIVHSYGDIYDSLFEPMRKSARRVLEIGVYSGASVLSFAEFFEGATVDGIDISKESIKFGLDNPRITYHLLDGTKQSTRDQLTDKYDVILDDASHEPNDQIETFRLFASSISPGGVYIIEDVNGPKYEFLVKKIGEIASAHGFETEWHDLRNVKGRWDDIVGVFRKKLD